MLLSINWQLALGKKFIIGIKSNRTVALSGKDKKLGKFKQVSSLLTLRKISETRINVVILGRIKRKTQEVWLRRYWIYIRTI